LARNVRRALEPVRCRAASTPLGPTNPVNTERAISDGNSGSKAKALPPEGDYRNARQDPRASRDSKMCGVERFQK
jgi:hypothetical protein